MGIYYFAVGAFLRHSPRSGGATFQFCKSERESGIIPIERSLSWLPSWRNGTGTGRGAQSGQEPRVRSGTRPLSKPIYTTLTIAREIYEHTWPRAS